MTVVLSLFLPQWLPRLFNISTTHEQVDIKALTYRWILTWIGSIRRDESYMRAWFSPWCKSPFLYISQFWLNIESLDLCVRSVETAILVNYPSGHRFSSYSKNSRRLLTDSETAARLMPHEFRVQDTRYGSCSNQYLLCWYFLSTSILFSVTRPLP